MVQYEILALRFSGLTLGSGAFLMWLKDWDKKAAWCGYFFCIRDGNETIIVDKGCTPEKAEDRKVPGYNHPADVLSRIGIKASDVRHVILTHMHLDHTSGVSLFPNATFYSTTFPRSLLTTNK